MQTILLNPLDPCAKEETQPNHFYFLTSERIEIIGALLKKCMSENKPFLQAGFCIRHLSELIQIPSYQLSAYVNQVLGLNFNDYCNWFRVRYCQELMHTDKVDSFNLRGLSRQCGFNNRNTMTTAFKKFTGFTPSVYQRSVAGGNADVYFMWQAPQINGMMQKNIL